MQQRPWEIESPDNATERVGGSGALKGTVRSQGAWVMTSEQPTPSGATWLKSKIPLIRIIIQIALHTNRNLLCISSFLHWCSDNTLGFYETRFISNTTNGW